MYRNLHGSGDMDAEVDAICTKGRGDEYRITVNNTLKLMNVIKDANAPFWFEDLIIYVAMVF